MDKVSSTCTEAADLTDADARAFAADLRQNTAPGNHFYIGAKTTSIDIPFQINAQEYLPLGGIFTADEYMEIVHPDYLVDYLEWALAAYACLIAGELAPIVKPLKVSYRIEFPAMLKNGRYHWMLMEAIPFQVDRNGIMLTHLNKYTPLRAFEGGPKRELSGELWEGSFLRPDWTRLLRKERLTHAYFLLTPVEREIIDLHHRNPAFKNRDIAAALGKQENNVERHQKNIIAKAKESFPSLAPASIKELVAFLEPYGYFDDAPVTR